MGHSEGLLILDYFECDSCKGLCTLKHMGEVISNPFCKLCHKPMRKIKLKQTTLFDDPVDKTVRRKAREAKGK